jgi:tetratricopeptide (TPR) repeat protein
MARPCPNCGTPSAAEARFCRLCGTPLRQTSSAPPVSPGAATVPLSDEGRTTSGISTEDGNSAPETARVRRSEMESILRGHAAHPSPPPSARQETNKGQVFTDPDAIAAPDTTALAGGTDGVYDSEAASVTRARAETVLAAHDETNASLPASADGAPTNEKPGAAAPSAAAQKTEVGARRLWQIAALALLVVAVGAGALAFYYARRSGTRDGQGATPISISDQRRLVEEKLAEAESLLASGNVTEAIARLRYAIRLEPSNPRGHRLLAEALERTGAVNEAIDEYRAATQYDPNNEETWLRYADALRRVGRTDEARDIYQKLSSSASAEVARTAKEQLAALPTIAASNPEQPRESRAQNRPEESAANIGGASSSSAPSPPSSTNSNGAGVRPKNDPVASYNTAMKIIEGKDIRKMNRAELIRAYELFQYAQSGPQAADANRRLRELDKELFERRKRK